jgi:alpha-L-fucosidase 2
MTRGCLLIDTAPADCWEDAFPVGNGRHGALVHGRPGAERVVVTHHDLTWLDAPAPVLPETVGPPDLAGRLPRVRDLLLAGESRSALELFTGDWPGYHPRQFHPAVAIVLRRACADVMPDGYRRTLSYRAGVAVTRWPGGRHACFVSRIRDLVVQQASGAAPWDAVVEVDARLPGAPAGLRIAGQVRSYAPGDAVIETTVQYAGCDEGYVVATRVTAYGGSGTTGGRGTTSIVGEHAVRVTGCGKLTVLTRVEAFGSAASPQGASPQAASPQAASPQAASLQAASPQAASLQAAGIGAARARALAAVNAVPARESRPLLAEHARAHAAAFGDVDLDLGVDAAQRRLPVADLLARQAARPDRPLPALLEKLFQSGRYLLLSASGLLPPRLPGLWQGDWNPAWSGAITIDANLGLQLAGAVTTDVPAAVDAVASLVRRQLPDWQVNAQRLFGTRGIVAPAHTDGRGGLATHFEPRWPLHMWTAGADWLLVPVLDEALARCDPGYAARHAGPALRELATFYEDFLTTADPGGYVVFAPSYSPENEPAGWTPAAVNATMDIAAARHALLAAAQLAAAQLPGASRRWRELADRLPPYRLSADGALAEWAWPPEGSGLPPIAANDEHRHVSHLYPVWPMHEITVVGTPALAAAALRALRARGAQDNSAHGYLHKALAAARLRDAVLAGRLLAALTGQGFFFRSLMSSHYPKRAVYNADAACALPGLLAEMLVDSVPADETGPGRIELLPAVPDFLPSGRLRGARTLLGVRVAELCWDSVAGHAEAVLVSAVDREADVSCGRQALGRQALDQQALGRQALDRQALDRQALRRRVRLPAGTPVQLTWGICDD